MRLEDMKKDIPETPEFIHTMIQSEVKKQLQDTKVVNIQTRRVKKWTGASVAAAIAVCVLATSTIVYAGTKLYHMFLEKQGAYSIVTGIKADGSTGKINLPEKIHEIDISTDYIPEGMVWTDDMHLQYSDQNCPGGFSFAFVLLDEDDFGKTAQDRNVVDYEERTFGNYEGVYLKYNDLIEDGSYNQRIYLLCPDVYRVVVIYISDNVEKEDVFNVAENLVINEKEEMIKTADFFNTWSEWVSSEEGSGGDMLTSVKDNKLPVHKVGDSIDMFGTGEDKNGNYIDNVKISVCADSVQIADDLQLLGENPIPQKWQDAVGADGKLITNTLSYVKLGDGVDTVDEVVKTGSVPQKLVYVTVTYTNQSEEEINHMLYLGSLMLLNHEDGRYFIQQDRSGNGFDCVIWDGAAQIPDMTYFSVSEDYGNGGNYISSLKPGESVQVNMAWIVNESDLDDIYLNLSGDGVIYEFSDSVLTTGLVDIRK